MIGPTAWSDGESARMTLPIERIEVPNPGSVMGEQPTNAYLVGSRDLVVIDPGSEAGAELVFQAVTARVGARVRALVLTHAHPDHAAATRELRQRFGCPVMLHPTERVIAPTCLSWNDVDVPLHDGQVIALPEGDLHVIETPGHSPGHVSLWHPAGRILLAGDLISGNGTVAIIPPHGTIRAYLASLERVRALEPRRILPGHGPEIAEPLHLIDAYVARRLHREQQIREALLAGPKSVDQLVSELYTDIQPQFRRAAMLTVLAHLEKLRDQGEVVLDDIDPLQASWRSIAPPGSPAPPAHRS
jgi:glyoxylase-like metal-dependent hydrolase (beta-lactamase superfamily II)